MIIPNIWENKNCSNPPTRNSLLTTYFDLFTGRIYASWKNDKSSLISIPPTAEMPPISDPKWNQVSVG